MSETNAKTKGKHEPTASTPNNVPGTMISTTFPK